MYLALSKKVTMVVCSTERLRYHWAEKEGKVIRVDVEEEKKREAERAKEEKKQELHIVTHMPSG